MMSQENHKIIVGALFVCLLFVSCSCSSWKQSETKAAPYNVETTKQSTFTEPTHQMTETLSPSATIIMSTITPAGVNSSPLTPNLQRDASATPSINVGISPEEATQIVPLSPNKVTVEIIDSGVLVKWKGTGEDVIQYDVMRSTMEDPEMELLGVVEAQDSNLGLHEFKDTDVKKGTTYVYGIRAKSSFGRLSTITNSDPITIP